MACEGGCVQGAGCLVRSPKNKLDVEKHAKEANDQGRGVVQAVSAAKGVAAPKPAKEKKEPAGKA
jgi:iron only hydrogenase large subunit-like protein